MKPVPALIWQQKVGSTQNIMSTYDNSSVVSELWLWVPSMTS